MVNGEHLHLVVQQAVDDPVTAEEYLSHEVLIEFRYNAAQTGVIGKSIGGPERPVGEDARQLRCVSRDEKADGFEIGEALESPAYASHFAMRSRASSWLINSPASAWRMPVSTL